MAVMTRMNQIGDQMKAVIDTCHLSEVKVGDPVGCFLRKALSLHQFLPSVLVLVWVWPLRLILRSARNDLDCDPNNTSMNFTLVSKLKFLKVISS